MPSSRLAEIVGNKRLEVAERKKLRSTEDLKSAVTKGDGRFLLAIHNRLGVNIITEIKPKSPTAGVLKENFVLEPILTAYNKFAAAISVLTDERYFGGSLELMNKVAQNTKRPILCKDFIIDRHQCYEARLNGAHAVLLIAKILEKNQIKDLSETIQSMGMTPVVEVNNSNEMEMVLDLQPSVILINNRNLDTFEVDVDTTVRLSSMLPSHTLRISASGIHTREQIEKLRTHDCNTFLVGSSLMRSENIEEKLAELIGSGPVHKG